MPKKNINVAIVGLGFGAEFIPIYQRHPNATMSAICQRTPEKLHAVGNAFGIEKRYTKFEDLLKDPAVDLVHINSPIPDHGWQSIAALKAGKHVSCTVPMATSIPSDCKKIVDVVKKTGLKYTMAETVVYAREYLFMKELLDYGQARQSSSSCRRAISRTWTAGRTTGPACRRCGTPRIASVPSPRLVGKPAEYVSLLRLRHDPQGTRSRMLRARRSPSRPRTSNTRAAT